jgi:hypothetical protein
VIVTSASGQRAVIIGLGVVCSRDVNGRSGHSVRKHVIAAKVVSKRLDAGGVGKRASGIARPTKVWSGGAIRRGVIGSGGVSKRGRQLTRIGWARASAQHLRATISRRAAAIARDATNTS